MNKLYFILILAFAYQHVLPLPTRSRGTKGAKLLNERIHADQLRADPEYHHEQFVGESQADLYDHLPSRAAKIQLGELVDKIDENGDGHITEDELVSWIAHVNRRLIFGEAERFWNAFKEGDPQLKDMDWETYVKSSFGEEIQQGKNLDQISDESRKFTFKEQLEWEKKRWNLADQNEDGKLNFDEFQSFLHPDDFPHMRNVVIEEAIRDMDRDKSNTVDIEEYMGEMLRDSEDSTPESRERHRQDFSRQRDTNKDGKLDLQEVADWVMPEGFSHAEAEATYLISMADADGDGKLSKIEIVDNHALFVGSAATEYGKVIDEF